MRRRRNVEDERRRMERAAAGGDLDAQARLEVVRMRAGELPVPAEQVRRPLQVYGPDDPWRIRREADSFSSEVLPLQDDLTVDRPYDSEAVSRYRSEFELALAEYHPPKGVVHVLTVQRTGWPFWRQLGSERLSMVIPKNAGPTWIVLGQHPAADLDAVTPSLERHKYRLRVPLRARWTHCKVPDLSLSSLEISRRLRALESMGRAGAVAEFAASGLLARAGIASRLGVCSVGPIGWFYGWALDVIPSDVMILTTWKRSPKTNDTPWLFSTQRAADHNMSPSMRWRAFDSNLEYDAANEDMQIGPPERGGEQFEDDDPEGEHPAADW